MDRRDRMKAMQKDEGGMMNGRQFVFYSSFILAAFCLAFSSCPSCLSC
jgi:hypothetical protein